MCPLYEFENSSGERTTFYYILKDYPKIGQVHKDENGKEWKRVFSSISGSSDTKIDPNNPQDFVEKTGKKKGTYGDLLDASKELSEKRAKDHGGKDPVQDKFFKDYSKQRHGVEHLQEKKKKKIDKEGFTISYQ